jgi:DNA adenine methylase
MTPSDPTGLERQRRHLSRLKQTGIIRKTIFVHEDCAPYLDRLKKHLISSKSAPLLLGLTEKLEREKPINVAQVKQLSPFRYPGGKTWLVPEIRHILLLLNGQPKFFIEPFAGGGIVGLTVAAEALAEKVILAEIDDGVAAVWKTIFSNPEQLCQRILSFPINREAVYQELARKADNFEDLAFQTILRNRTQHGGILAPGASLIRKGENRKGIASRWYPETLARRIRLLYILRNKINFIHDDGFSVIKEHLKDKDSVFYLDPPYTAGGKKSGKRLYLHNELDHERLFDMMAKVSGNFVMSYNDSTEVRELAEKHKFQIKTIPMKNTHHAVMKELLIMRH